MVRRLESITVGGLRRGVGLCLLLAGLPVSAGSRSSSPEQVSLQRGLSQSTVHAVLQDDDGFLWIGTDYGLNRFDGSEFIVFTHDPADGRALGGNRVRALAQDTGGALWVALLEGGLDRRDPVTGVFGHFRHDPDDPTSLASDSVRDVVVDSDGDLWIATADGLDRLTPGAGVFEHFRHHPDDPTSLASDSVTAVLADASGRVWIGTEGGAVDVWTSEGGFRHVWASPPSPVTCLAAGVADALWIGTDGGGVARLDPATGAVRRYRSIATDPGSLGSDLISSLLVDRAGGVWVGTADHGLYGLDPSSGRADRVLFAGDGRDDLASSWIGALFEDRSSILWIGTDFGGLVKRDLKRRPFVNLDGSDGLPSSVVFSVMERRGGELWIGTMRGPAVLDAVGESASPVPELDGAPVYALLERRDGSVWIGTWGRGLLRLDPDTGRTRSYRHRSGDPDSLANDVVHALLEDREGRLWVGTFGGGLDLLDPSTDSFVHHRASAAEPGRLRSDRVLALLTDSSGRLWVGTDTGGLSCLDPATGAFRTFVPDRSDPRSLSDASVGALAVDAADRLWVGTAGGLDRLDDDAGFVHYGRAEGLPNLAVAGLQIADDGQVWVAHFRGLSRLDPDTGRIVTFDDSDGLATLEFNTGASSRGPSGRLYFGGVDGLVAFRPSEVVRNPVAPLVAITRVEIYGEDLTPPGVLPRGPIRLTYTDDFLTISYVGLEFTAPERNRYLYRLDGVNRAWVDGESRRQVSYAHLRPGEYRFRVRAANNHGVWSRDEATLQVVLVPPFWQTWWFRLGAVICVVLAILGAVAGRMRTLRRRVVDQERLVEQRTRELAAANVRLEELAIRDELTGVANRRRFDQALAGEWRRCARFGRPVSVIMVDLDDFKRYNDTFGHLEGDRCLRHAAAAMAGVVSRPGDLFARYGGEEFTALLPETSSRAAASVAERMRATVEALAVPRPGLDPPPRVTVSIGVATRVPADGDDADTVVKAADEALYRAKAEGKNRVVVAPRSGG